MYLKMCGNDFVKKIKTWILCTFITEKLSLSPSVARMAETVA